MTKGAVAIFLLGALMTRAFAGTDEVRVWFEGQLELAAKPFVIPDYLVELEIVYPAKLTAEEVRALGERIKGRPDHPDRGEYEAQSRRLEHGGDHEYYSFAILDEHSFRISTDYEWNESSHDVGYKHHGAAWSMTPEQLRIAEPYTAPPGEDYQSYRNQIDAYLSALFFGGIRHMPPDSVRITAVEQLGDHPDWYVFTLTDESQSWEKTARVRWDATTGRGFVLACSYTRSEDTPELVGTGCETPDWVFNERLDRWVARKARLTVFGTRTDISLADLKPISRDEFDRAISIPTPGGVDPLRGKVTVAAVYDDRGGKQIVKHVDAGGEAIQDRGSGGSGRDAYVVWIGRVALLGALSIVVGIYFIKQRKD